MAMTNAAAALGRAFQQDDQRRAADAQERAQKYAALVLCVVDGDFEEVESIDDALAELGRSRDELAVDVRRLEQRRGERQRAGAVLAVMREHRVSERAVIEAQAALQEAMTKGRERIAAAHEAEERARIARYGVASVVDVTLRLAPERLSFAFTGAERELIDAEEQVAGARARGADPAVLARLESELEAADRKAAAAWAAVRDHDPAPGAVMRPVREYDARPARFSGVPFPRT